MGCGNKSLKIERGFKNMQAAMDSWITAHIAFQASSQLKRWQSIPELFRGDGHRFETRSTLKWSSRVCLQSTYQQETDGASIRLWQKVLASPLTSR